eukprot:14327095-Alexandrium_andersonii.AAC.1
MRGVCQKYTSVCVGLALRAAALTVALAFAPDQGPSCMQSELACTPCSCKAVVRVPAADTEAQGASARLRARKQVRTMPIDTQQVIRIQADGDGWDCDGKRKL